MPKDNRNKVVWAKLTFALRGLLAYLRTRSLAIQSTKTQAIMFTRRGTGPQPLRVKGTAVQWLPTVRWLGVTLDAKCSWDPHLRSVAGRAGGVMLKLAPLLHPASPMEYGHKIRLFCSVYNHIRSVYHRFLRLIFGAPPRVLLTMSGLPSLDSRIRGLAERFFSRAQASSNMIVRGIGDYDAPGHPYRRIRDGVVNLFVDVVGLSLETKDERGVTKDERDNKSVSRFGGYIINAVTGESVTFSEVLKKSLSVAANLRRRGLWPRDRLAVMSENHLDFFLPVLGSYFLGVACANISPAYTPRELLHALNITQPPVLFCSPACVPTVKKVAKQATFVKLIVVFGEDTSHGYVPLSAFLNGGDIPFTASNPNHEAEYITNVLCTSGTTGLPKGASITDRNLFANLLFFNERGFGKLDPDHVMLGVVPYVHVFGLILQLLCFSHGLTVVVMPRFQEKLFLESIQRYKVSFLSLVPTLMVFLAKSPLVDQYDLSSLKEIWCGAAPLSPDMQARVTARLGVKHVQQGYGSTELMTALHVPLGRDKLDVSVHRSVLGGQVKHCLNTTTGGDRDADGQKVLETFFRADSSQTGKDGESSRQHDGWKPNGANGSPDQGDPSRPSPVKTAVSGTDEGNNARVSKTRVNSDTSRQGVSIDRKTPPKGEGRQHQEAAGGNPNHLGDSSGDESEVSGGPGQSAPALGKGGKRRKPTGNNASRASPQPGTRGFGPAGRAKGKVPTIILCDVEDYSKVARAIRSKIREPVEVKFLPSLGIRHWSYELGRERLVRVVVKGLLTGTNPGEIQEESVEMGFPVKSITQMLSQCKRDHKTGERQRLPNFVVSLTPGEHTTRLYSISVLCGLRIRVEKYKSPGGPVQCKNCFRFGHVRRDCRANPRCGFCGGDHERGRCPEEIRSPSKCLHCSGAHSSAWRGCPTYRSLRAAVMYVPPRATVTPAPTPKPLVQSFASALSKRPTAPPQAEAPAKATIPEPVASGSTLSVEGPPETDPLPIPTPITPTTLTSTPTPLHPSNPFLPLPAPTLVTTATPTPDPLPTPEDDTSKLKICIELLKSIPGLNPWDFSSSLLRKVKGPPTLTPFPLNPIGFLDVLDFVVYRGIRRRLVLKSVAEFNSDHNLVLREVGTHSSLSNSGRNRSRCGAHNFRHQRALEASTPRHRPRRAPQASLPDFILRHVQEKNRLRKAWKISRNPADKANWSRKVHVDRTLWQMTRNLMRVPTPRPPIVANSDQEKADALAEHLEAQFVPTDSPSDPVHVAQLIGSVSNGLTLYKQLLRPILDYACPTCGHLADTYMRRMQAFQSVCLRLIVGAPWYVRNETLYHDLDMPTIKDHFRRLAQSFYARLSGATNPFIQGLGNYVIDVPKPCSDKRDETTVILDLVTGKTLGPKKEGELCFKGAQIMKGYYGDSKSTSECFDKEGYFHTGDVGYYDTDGYFFIVDRIKELIKYKAFQVAPAELEAILLKHPSIEDAAVVGVPDEVSGELPKAFVVKKQGVDVTEEEIIKFVEGQVSPHKKLRGGVTFIDSIPKTSSGKILRRELRNSSKSKL
uniref:CCHC-type domain-containing protein n=1 Tax=Timema poppense TaxID=170557 RepID=A0A7R9GVD9_TIMPO|nr:unnamed protein product [Timema poppensis]